MNYVAGARLCGIDLPVRGQRRRVLRIVWHPARLAGVGDAGDFLRMLRDHHGMALVPRQGALCSGVSNPDMLLLDEPNNYLDIVAIRWLEDF